MQVSVRFIDDCFRWLLFVWNVFTDVFPPSLTWCLLHLHNAFLHILVKQQHSDHQSSSACLHLLGFGPKALSSGLQPFKALTVRRQEWRWFYDEIEPTVSWVVASTIMLFNGRDQQQSFLIFPVTSGLEDCMFRNHGKALVRDHTFTFLPKTLCRKIRNGKVAAGRGLSGSSDLLPYLHLSHIYLHGTRTTFQSRIEAAITGFGIRGQKLCDRVPTRWVCCPHLSQLGTCQ